MNRVSIFVVFVAVTTVVAAQERLSVVADLRDREYTQVRRFTIAAAELMPAELYGKSPVSGLRSFGQEIAHIAMANARLCRGIAEGVIQLPAEYAKLEAEPSKDKLVSALKDTFALCDRAFATLTDENSQQVISSPAGRRGPRGGLLTTVVAHTNEEYGKLTMHLRLSGLVPPSSAQR